MGKDYSFHKVCLAAIFFFDNASLFIPLKNAKSGELSAILTAMAASIVIYVLWYYAVDGFYRSKGGTVFSKAVCLLLIAALLFTNTVSAANFVDYMNGEVLIKNAKIFVLLIFAAICIYVVSKSNEAAAKSALLIFVFTVAVMAVMTVISAKNFEAVSLKELFVGKVVKRASFYLYKVFLYPLAFAVFSRFAFFNVSVKKDILGFAVGSALITVCFLSAVLTFTLPFASKIDYAYPMSISVVNIGELYTRMDGFAYFIFFFSALVKCTVCGLGIKMLLKRAGDRKPFAKTAILMILSFAASYIV